MTTAKQKIKNTLSKHPQLLELKSSNMVIRAEKLWAPLTETSAVWRKEQQREKIGHENINMRYERWWVLPPFKMLVAGATQYPSIRDAASEGERWRAARTLLDEFPLFFQPLELVLLSKRQFIEEIKQLVVNPKLGKCLYFSFCYDFVFVYAQGVNFGELTVCLTPIGSILQWKFLVRNKLWELLPETNGGSGWRSDDVQCKKLLS